MTRRTEVGPGGCLNVRLPAITQEALTQMSQSTGLTKASIIREALDGWLQQQGATPAGASLPVYRKSVA